MMESVRTKIIGVGGAGVNTVGHILQQPNPYISYAIIDSDIKTLKSIEVPEKLTIGHNITRGLSSGGDPAIALKAIEADKERIEALIQDIDLIFIIAGLGGGIGSVVSSYLNGLAAKKGCVIISFVIMPFTIEGGQKHQIAEKYLGDIRIVSHATIPLPNDLLLQNLSKEATVAEAFQLASTWISRAVYAVSNIIYQTGIVNLDFASLKRVFLNGGGKTLFGLGIGQGMDYCKVALNELTLCPLLHTPHAYQRADSILINIIGGRNLSLHNVNEIGSFLSTHFNSKENMAIGAIIDETKEDFVEIVVIGVTDINKDLPHSANRGRLKTDVSYNQQQQLLFDDLPYVMKGGKRKSSKKSVAGSDPTDLDGSAFERGYFGQLEPVLINGEDIDVPTYLRRGIKVDLGI